MAIPIVLLLSVAAIATIFIWPKSSAILIWPVLFLYPNGWWAKVGFLPLDIGFDDLFIVIATINVFFRLNLGRGVPIRMGWSLKIAFSMLVIVALTNVSGYLECGSLPMLRVLVKVTLKLATFVMTAYILANSIDNLYDLKRVWRAFLVSVILCAALTVYMYFDPSITHMFSTEKRVHLVEMRQQIGEHRATGSLIEPNTIGIVMAVGVGMLLTDFAFARKWLYKAFLLAGAVMMTSAAMLSQSRTGLVAFATIPTVLLFRRGMRKLAIFVILLVVISIVAIPQLYAPVIQRFMTPEGEMSTTSLNPRIKVWVVYLQKLDVRTVLFGQGEAAAIIKTDIGMQPHSGYLNLLCYYGIWGILWGGLMVHGAMRRLSWIRRQAVYPDYKSIGKGAELFLIILGAFSLTAEAFSPTAWTLRLLFMFLVFVDRAQVLSLEEYEVAWDGEESANGTGTWSHAMA